MNSPDHDQNTAETRQRKIIHIDMDAFYASVEQRDNPDLRGKAVAVGGSRERGVVAAASYEARKFGIRSAMPSVTAKRQCPDLVFVKPRFEVYKEISRLIRTIFAEHTEIIEPLSLDEAYLDVTKNIQGIPIATEIATMIRAKILSETGLTASAGISYNKFLAKLASDQNKPNGQFVITPRMGPSFVQVLPVARHRRAPRPRQPNSQIGRRREHLLAGSSALRSSGGGIEAADREGLASLRDHGRTGPNGDAQGKVFRFRVDHAQQVSRRH